MRMSHLASIVFACCISIFTTASLAQQSSNDGRCDELNDATPSLYGLCIAYWATQENGNSEASSKILEKYNARKSTGDDPDPDMPGVGICPCWTAEELTRWKTDTPKPTYCLTSLYGDAYTGWIGTEPADQLYAIDLPPEQGGYFGCVVQMSSSTNGNGTAVGRGIYSNVEGSGMDESSFQACLMDAVASAEGCLD